jgi:hypothetical protein
MDTILDGPGKPVRPAQPAFTSAQKKNIADMDGPLVSAVYEANWYATVRRLSLDPDPSEEDAGETGTVGTHRRGSSEMEMARIGGGRSYPPPPASSTSGEGRVRRGQRWPGRSELTREDLQRKRESERCCLGGL